MIVDIIYLIIVIMAIWKGYKRGFIVGVFSFAAIFVGLAAAIKFSVIVSGWLQSNTNISGQWLPFVSFLIVMIAVMILIGWLARLLQASMELVMLGWLNRAGGILFYLVLYTIIFSIVLFYATQMGILKTETVASSPTYSMIEPWGPKAIEMLGTLVPVFKNMFQDLKNFFGSLAQKGS
jgi:membrane protein required for colicin V production